MTKKSQTIHEDTKTNIFLNAARLFAEKGYNGVSMREISERSKVSKPTIYYYFGSKEGIYKKLLDEGIRHCTGHFKEIQVMPVSSMEKLVLIVKELFHDALKYPEMTKFFINLFMISENLDFLVNYHSEAVDHAHIFRELIEEGIRAGEFAAEADSELVAHMLMGTVVILILHQLKMKKRILTDAISEEIVSRMFYGIQNRKLTIGGTDAVAH